MYPELLRRQLEVRQIDVIYPGGDSECVQALLRSAAGQISEPAAFGIEVFPQYVGLSPLRLRDLVDSEFHTLSEAHYQRYIKA